MTRDRREHDYRDEAAAQLYKDSGGPVLVAAHGRIAKALNKQGEKLEEYFNSPYTENSAMVLEASTRALVAIREELHHWHRLIYPNSDGGAA